VLRTADLTDHLEVALRRLLLDAFADDFSDDDWEHALGGEHVIVDVGGRPVAHASVVPRVLELGDRAVRTGYVEAVGTASAVQGRGFGRRVMGEIEALVRRDFEMGALATGELEFYARLGWEWWRGPTSVRRGDQLVRSPDEDGAIMVLRFGPSAEVDLDGPIACAERRGDDW
jgi:aminoglycoside 2'-N-acetyltransferase I